MEWFKKLDGNVIVCDAEGMIIYMNETAIRNYAKPHEDHLPGAVDGWRCI